MISETDKYHGAVLRNLIAAHSDTPIAFQCVDQHGRLDAFLINARAGIYIKHSTKRLSPWSFAFHQDHLNELEELKSIAGEAFVILVCGIDGILVITLEEFNFLLGDCDLAVRSLRVSRDRNSMYSITCSRRTLPRKLSRGVDRVLQAAFSN
tara:strand:+ start:2231 stop:2686 length:456 start_codon:yes stop_codon:yes gene_type:complete